MSHQIIYVEIKDDGNVDVQVRGSSLSIETYGKIIGITARMTANLFSETGEIESKEAVRAILKAANKSAHDTAPMNVRSASLN